jgi:hypothetical protein
MLRQTKRAGNRVRACGDEAAPAAMKLVNTHLRKKCSAPAAMRKRAATVQIYPFSDDR